MNAAVPDAAADVSAVLLRLARRLGIELSAQEQRLTLPLVEDALSNSAIVCGADEPELAG